MSKKRWNSGPDAGEGREEKRRKIADGRSQPEPIVSARQLQQLLLFAQDDISELRNSESGHFTIIFACLTEI